MECGLKVAGFLVYLPHSHFHVDICTMQFQVCYLQEFPQLAPAIATSSDGGLDSFLLHRRGDVHGLGLLGAHLASKSRSSSLNRSGRDLGDGRSRGSRRRR